MNILILLAHQDDELGLLPIIHDLYSKNHTINIIFLTNGAAKHRDPFIRNQESITVLNKFGIKLQNIHFFGSNYRILDKHLVENLYYTRQRLLQYLNDYNINPHMVICQAWEGGHPDHDAGHLLALSIAKKFNILHNCYQFYFYNSQSWSIVGKIKLFNPLRCTLTPKTKHFSSMNGIRYFNSYWLYKSQRFAILWMLPAIFIEYIVKRRCTIYQVDIKNIQVAPHEGILRYEKNNFYSKHDFFMYAKSFINELLEI